MQGSFAPFEVETNANDYAIGVVLYQDGKPIAFESKKLDSAQRRYTVQERELFAVIHALKTWRHYLYGNHFVVTTNHESLKYFCDQQDLKGRQAPWADLIQNFDFSIRYRKGSMNIVADALSRVCEVNMLSFTEIYQIFMIMFEKSILMTVILRNTGQQVSL